MTIIEAVVLGAVQGVFMFFPVSSTSHLVMAQHWMIANGSLIPRPETAEMILFDLVVHLGTLVSIALVFRPRLAGFLTRVKRDLHPQAATRDRVFLKLALLSIVTVAVTGLIGLPVRAYAATFFGRPLVLSITLAVTGLLLYFTDVTGPRPRGLRQLTVWVALAIGIAQGLALLPGLSRSGLTISVALFLGLKRRWAAEYSFFVAFPTIIAASVVQAVLALRGAELGAVSSAAMLTGFLVAAVVGVFALRIVISLLYQARFRFFSYYVWSVAGVTAAMHLFGL